MTYLVALVLCFYLQVLEGVIKYRWNALPVEQRDGMKNYISDVIVQVIFVVNFLEEMLSICICLVLEMLLLHTYILLMSGFCYIAFKQWGFFSVGEAVCQQTQYHISAGLYFQQ